MTLKQFFQVAAGAVVALITYSLPIYPLIKWPLIIIFALFGFALAFLPFQERPLEQWIIAFFRSVYSPTVFRWKSQHAEEYFIKEAAAEMKPKIPETKAQPMNIPFINSLEETEGKFLGKLALLFNSSNPIPVPAVAPNPAPSPTPIPTAGSSVLTTESVGLGQQQSTNPTPQYGVVAQSAPSTQAVPELTIPQTGSVSVPKMVVEETSPAAASKDLSTFTVGQTIAGSAPVASKQTQFSTEAAPPSVPTIPNTISGQVIDPDGKIIEGAILEIRDKDGRPVRALRSNKVGHFLTVTPLLNGRYEIITEKEGYLFEPSVLNINGGIIPPIAVRAKGRPAQMQVVS